MKRSNKKSVDRKQIEKKNKGILRKRGRPSKRNIREAKKQYLEQKASLLCRKYLDRYHWGMKKRLDKKILALPKTPYNYFMDAVYYMQTENGPLKAISSIFSKCQLLWGDNTG